MKKWLSILLVLVMAAGLCACGQSTPANDAAPAESAVPDAVEAAPDETVTEKEDPIAAYRVTITDTEGNPLSDVTVQFSDGSTHTTGETGANGTALFTAKGGPCTLRVLKVPEGVNGTDEEYAFTRSDGELRIELVKPKPAADFPEAGFSFYNPEQYENIAGVLDWKMERIYYNLFYVLYPNYYAVAKDDTAGYGQLKNAGNSNQVDNPYYLLCVQMDPPAAEDFLRSRFESLEFEMLASENGVTCFLEKMELSEEEQNRHKAGMGEFYDEFMALRGDREALLSGIRLRKPVPESMLFETQDLDGNPVDLADVFAGHEVTMVNIWETGCVPCINEMPGLEQLNKTFEEQNCQIIGVCTDYQAGSPDNDTSKAKDILTRTGVTYLNVILPENNRFPSVRAWPTSYFVDGEGRILSSPVQGAYVDVENYSKDLEKALSFLELLRGGSD